MIPDSLQMDVNGHRAADRESECRDGAELADQSRTCMRTSTSSAMHYSLCNTLESSMLA
jgi:hypothetical protein